MKKTVYQDLLIWQTRIALGVGYTEVVGFSCITSWLYFIIGIRHTFLIVSAFFTIVLLVNLLLYPLYKKIYFTYLIHILVLYINVIVFVFYTGGIVSPVIFIFIVFPIGGFITSRKHGIRVSVFILLTILIIFFAEDIKIPMADFIPDNSKNIFSFAIMLFVTSITFVMWLISNLSTINIYRIKNQIEDMKEEIEQQRDIAQNKNVELSTFNKKLKQSFVELEMEKNKMKIQRNKLMDQRNKISKQRENITHSINYTKRIQTAILPSEEYINKSIPNHFILYKPREIVSGDFYWVHSSPCPPLIQNLSEKEKRGIGETERRKTKQSTDSPIHPFTDSVRNNGGEGVGASLIIAVCDCKVHGVSGAFMSILGVALLNEIVSKNANLQANEILNQLRVLIIKSLHQTGKEGEITEGIDIALCIVNTVIRNGKSSATSLQYAGAFNPLYIIRNPPLPAPLLEDVGGLGGAGLGLPSAHNESAELFEIKANRMSVGVHFNQDKLFTNHQIKIQAGDIIYIFTDGYADQFGSNENKKFKFKRFKELLLSLHKKPMKEQKLILDTTIEKWRAHTDPITRENIEQTDDILVIGMRF